MQPAPQAYWDAQRNEVQVVWGIGGRHRHFRLPPHPANYDVLSVEAINDSEVAIYYGREGNRPQWVQVVDIMSGGVHQSTNWQAYRDGLARRAQQEHSLVRFAQEQQSREAEAKAREQREQQCRALAVRPKAQIASYRADTPARRELPPNLPARREFIESRSASGDYNEDEFEYDDYYADVPRQYALAFDVTPKPRRSKRTGWTWLGGGGALFSGLVGLVLNAAAPTSGPMPAAEAFAFLSALLVTFFGLIGLTWPRVGGFAVILFATFGAGLTMSVDVRIWMVAGFAGGLLLWFGRRNRARHGTMRKLVRVTVLAGVAALMLTAISRQ